MNHLGSLTITLIGALGFSYTRTHWGAWVLLHSHPLGRLGSLILALIGALRFSNGRALYQTRSPMDVLSTDDVHWSAPGLQRKFSIERSNEGDYGGHRPEGPRPTVLGIFQKRHLVRRGEGR